MGRSWKRTLSEPGNAAQRGAFEGLGISFAAGCLPCGGAGGLNFEPTLVPSPS
jgi:hypothetical protein